MNDDPEIGQLGSVPSMLPWNSVIVYGVVPPEIEPVIVSVWPESAVAGDAVNVGSDSDMCTVTDPVLDVDAPRESCTVTEYVSVVVDETDGSVAVHVRDVPEIEHWLVDRDPPMVWLKDVTEYPPDPPEMVPVSVSVVPAVPDVGFGDSAGRDSFEFAVTDAAFGEIALPLSESVTLTQYEVVKLGETESVGDDPDDICVSVPPHVVVVVYHVYVEYELDPPEADAESVLDVWPESTEPGDAEIDTVSVGFTTISLTAEYAVALAPSVTETQ